MSLRAFESVNLTYQVFVKGARQALFAGRAWASRQQRSSSVVVVWTCRHAVWRPCRARDGLRSQIREARSVSCFRFEPTTARGSCPFSNIAGVLPDLAVGFGKSILPPIFILRPLRCSVALHRELC